MIPPENFLAIPLARLPIDLEFIRDIEEFDGPLLSEFRSSAGDSFLYYWCDCNEEANRWLVVRTPRQDLFRYFVGRISLRSLIRECRDGFLYIVDLDADATPLSAWFALPGKLPDNYLPGPESVRQPGAGIEPGFQDVYVDQKWVYEKYPKTYIQAYAFHTAFGRGGTSNSLSVVYRLTKGYIFDTLFKVMHANAPLSRRASLEAVAFASPGYLRFRVDPEIAAGVRAAVARYSNNRSELRRTIKELRNWANGNDYLPEAEARRLIWQVADTLGIDGLALLSHIDTIEHTGKVLDSYLTRLDFLATNEAKQTAMLVGFTLGGEERKEKTAHPPPGDRMG